MKKIARFGILLFLAAALSIGGAFPAKAKEPMIVAGSGVNLGITRILAAAYAKKNPAESPIVVPGSIGSGGAVAAVADGGMVLGLISRPLKEKEAAKGLRAMAYAMTPLVIAVHSRVADDRITSAEVVSIFKGEKTKWMDGKEVIVHTREPFDSGMQLLGEKIPGFKQAYEESQEKKRWTVYFTDQESNHSLVETPGVIGVTDLGMIMTEKLAIKPLILDGIVASPETLENGQYPLGRTLYFVYREGALTREAQAFIDFVFSQEAALLLRAHGYLPVGRAS